MPAAIVLAGGEGRRLGGISKPDVTIGGRRMIDIVLDSLHGYHPRVVVGGAGLDLPADVVRTLEDPPLGGPAAGVAAGLEALTAASDAEGAPGKGGAARSDAAHGSGGAGTLDDEVLVLACDLPGAASIVAALTEAGPLPDGVDGIVLARPDGRRDWLALRTRTASLRRAVLEIGNPRDRSMRDLLAPLTLATAPAPGRLADDVDTWSDRRAWEQRSTGGRTERPPVTQQDDYERTLAPWIAAACSELGLTVADVDVDVDAVHRLTGAVADQVQRSMAPISAYLVGVAVGRGMTFAQGVAAVERSLPRLAE